MTRRLAALALLVLVACSSGGNGGFGSPPAGTTAPATPSTASASPEPPSPVPVRIETPGDRYEPERVVLELNVPVVLELRNTDGRRHALTVNELSLLMTAEPGESVRLPVTPGEAGAFTMFCSVPGHRAAGHEGILEVR